MYILCHTSLISQIDPIEFIRFNGQNINRTSAITFPEHKVWTLINFPYHFPPFVPHYERLQTPVWTGMTLFLVPFDFNLCRLSRNNASNNCRTRNKMIVLWCFSKSRLLVSNMACPLIFNRGESPTFWFTRIRLNFVFSNDLEDLDNFQPIQEKRKASNRETCKHVTFFLVKTGSSLNIKFEIEMACLMEKGPLGYGQLLNYAQRTRSG